MVKPRVIERQTQQLLPVQAGPHGVGRLSVGQVFHKLQHAHQCQAPRAFGGLAAPLEQGLELFIVKYRTQSVTDRQIAIPFGKVRGATRAVSSGIPGICIGFRHMVLRSPVTKSQQNQFIPDHDIRRNP